MRAFIFLILIFSTQSSHAQFKIGHYGLKSRLLSYCRDLYINADSTFTSEASYSNNIQPIWKGKWNITNDTFALSGLISYPFTGFRFYAITDSTIKGIKIEFKFSSGEPVSLVPVYIYCFGKKPVDTLFSNSSGVVIFSETYLKQNKCTSTICYSILGDSECNQQRLSQPETNFFKITYEQGHPNPKKEIFVEKYLIKNETLIPINFLGNTRIKEYILTFTDKSYR